MTQENQEAFDRIRKAVDARDRFLRDHPELQPLQDEITRLMRDMGSPHNRMVLLDTLLREKVLELQRRLVELREAFLAALPEGDDSSTDPEPPQWSALVREEISPEQAVPRPGSEQAADPPAAAGADQSDAPGKILGPGSAWPVPDGLTGRDRPDRPARPQPHARHAEDDPGTPPPDGASPCP